MKRFITLIGAALMAVTMTGCAIQQASTYDPMNSFIRATNQAVDGLSSQLLPTDQNTKPLLDINAPILVATIVDIDNLEQTSRLGRTISEAVSSRLTQRGFKVIEVKLRGNIYIKKSQGEFLLTREFAEIVKEHHAPAVVVGTYAPARPYVAVNVKVVSADDQIVLAATSYGLDLGWEMGKLLEEKGDD